MEKLPDYIQVGSQHSWPSTVYRYIPITPADACSQLSHRASPNITKIMPTICQKFACICMVANYAKIAEVPLWKFGSDKILLQMTKAHKWCISHDYKTTVPLIMWKWYDNNCKANTIWLLWSVNACNNANIAITHLYPPHKPLHSQMKRQASKAGFTPAVCERPMHGELSY